MNDTVNSVHAVILQGWQKQNLAAMYCGTVSKIISLFQIIKKKKLYVAYL